MYLDVHMYLCFNMQMFYSQSVLKCTFIPHKFIQPENLLQTCQSTHPLSIWPVKKNWRRMTRMLFIEQFTGGEQGFPLFFQERYTSLDTNWLV